MNTARLARRFAEAKNDPIVMAEAIGAEIAEDYVTRDLLAEQVGLLRGDMASLRAELRGEMAGLKAELRGEMQLLRAELGAELKTEGQSLRVEMAGMKADLQRTLILTQIAGFVAILVAVFLKS